MNYDKLSCINYIHGGNMPVHTVVSYRSYLRSDFQFPPSMVVEKDEYHPPRKYITIIMKIKYPQHHYRQTVTR